MARRILGTPPPKVSRNVELHVDAINGLRVERQWEFWGDREAPGPIDDRISPKAIEIFLVRCRNFGPRLSKDAWGKVIQEPSHLPLEHEQHLLNDLRCHRAAWRKLANIGLAVGSTRSSTTSLV